jgi:hypothetical protein
VSECVRVCLSVCVCACLRACVFESVGSGTHACVCVRVWVSARLWFISNWMRPGLHDQEGNHESGVAESPAD